MGISFSGIGSGIDSESLITSLVAAEKQPEQAMQTAQSNLRTQISTLGTLVTQLQSLGSAADALSSASEIQAPTATSSDTSRIGVSAGANATPGSYRITVNALAQAQTILSTGYASNDAGVAGTGSLTLTVGPTGNPIQVNFGANDSLTDIANNINAQVSGVTASVVYDGSQYHLQVTSNDTGKANAVTITESGGSLAMDDPNNIKQPAQDASITINGVTLNRSSNTITDAVNGVTLNVASETPTGGAPTTVTIATDTPTLQSRAQSIIDAYNKVVKSINAQVNYTGTQLGANTLFGDSTIQGLQLGLGTLVTQSFSYGSGSITTADLGITLGADGTLALDSTKFASAVQSDPLALQHLLVGDGTSANGGLVAALQSTVKTYTQYGTGLLVTEQSAKQTQIDGYDKQIAAVDDRANSLETTLRAQFTTLDSVMSNYKSQQSYLMSLFATKSSG